MSVFTHKVVGKYSGKTYFVGTLTECEAFIAHEIDDSFEIEGI